MSDDLVKRLREDQPVTQDMASTVQCALQDAAADRIEELEERLKAATDDAKEAEAYAEELEANLAEQIEWVKGLADDLIAAEGREARLKEKLAKVEEALRGWIDFANEQGMPVSLSDLGAAQLTGGKDE